MIKLRINENVKSCNRWYYLKINMPKERARKYVTKALCSTQLCDTCFARYASQKELQCTLSKFVSKAKYSTFLIIW